MSKKRPKKKKPGRSKPIPQKQPPSPPPSRSSRLHISEVILFFTAVVVLITYIIARIQFIDIPLNRDEGVYGYLGKMAIQGGVPYVDFYEMKPPFLFYVYGISGFIFGYSDVGLRITVMLLNLISAFFIYKTAFHFTRSKSAGLVAFMVFLMLSLNQNANGFAAGLEHFLNLFITSGTYFLVSEAENKQIKKLVLSGVLFACVAMIKQTGALFIIAAGVYIVVSYVFFHLKDKKISTLFRTYWPWVASILLVPVLVLFIIFLVGGWGEFYYWVFEYPSLYVSSISSENAWNYFTFFGKNFFIWQWPIFLLVFMGVLGVWRSGKLSTLTIIYIIAGFISLIPGYRFYPQYWLLLLPGLALLASGVFLSIHKLPRLPQLAATIVIFLLVMSEIISNERYYFRTDGHRIVNTAFRGDLFVEMKTLSKWLNREMNDSDQMMVLGSEPEAYLYTGKEAPTRHIYHGIITRPTPSNQRRQQEAYNDLTRTFPEYVIFNTHPFTWTFKEDHIQYLYSNAYSFVTNNYRPIAYADILPGGTKYLYGNQAINYNPQSNKYIVIYQKR